MKRILSLFLVFCMMFGLVACGTTPQDSRPSESQPQQTENIPQTTQPVYSEDMLELLNKLVETVQPGTAGSSMKAIYAARDLVVWVKDNRPDMAIIQGTIKQFFATTEYDEEAIEAFQNIKNVFVTIFESDMAQSLLSTVEMKISEFELSDEAKQIVDKIFEEVEKYTRTE